MLGKVLFIVFLSAGSLAAQTSITITDSNGNRAIAAVYNGNLYYHDSKGNFASGTVRDGNVFVNTSSNELIFGTIKNGNLFLTDKKGITTGTIQDGNIFLNNGDGSYTSGTYTNTGNVVTNTTFPDQTSNPPSDTELQKRTAQQQQQDFGIGYELGYGVTTALTDVIDSAVQRHELSSYCNANPTSVYQAGDGTRTPCPKAPITDKAQKVIDGYCEYHPGERIRYGTQIIPCDTPPDPGNLVWAIWGMNTSRSAYKMYTEKRDETKVNEAREAFDECSRGYCILTGTGSSYDGLDGNIQHCK